MRPIPTRVYHFTRLEHLPTIMEHGLVCDTQAQLTQLLAVEIGNLDIKARRALTCVPVSPGGTVADYAPFYFAPRSPMMYAIHMGNVPTYTEGTGKLVYLVTTLERLQQLSREVILTDRNAVLRVAQFERLADGFPDDDFIDWQLMDAKYWGEYPDGRERRMAECLVHQSVPWEAFVDVAVKSRPVAERVRAMLPSRSVPSVSVRPEYYF